MEKKINVKNVHLAEITELESGLQYGTPEHIIGAMEIGKKPNVSTGKLYGDGKIAHTTSKKSAFDLVLDLNKLPTKWRRYMEGTTVNGGVEKGTSGDEPKPFAIGWEVEKTGGKSELIWFLYCKANPIEEKTQQSEENIIYSTDSIAIMAIEHADIGRFYTLIDTEDEDVSEEMAENFFKKVQTTDSINA